MGPGHPPGVLAIIKMAHYRVRLSLMLPESNEDAHESSCLFLGELQRMKTEGFKKDMFKGFFLGLSISDAQLSSLLQLNT